MKKYLILAIFCLSSLVSAAPIRDHKIDPVALSELALALGISPDQDIVEEAQKRWLRKAGQERWEIAELDPEQRLFVLTWAKENGFFTRWEPASETYDKALIFGAATPAMQRRLEYLKQLWLEGTRFNEIVWLTGDRPLDSRIDGFTEVCNKESEAARLIWCEANLPEEMRKLPIVFVAAPMKNEGSALIRPNSVDTMAAWLQISPIPCKVIFVSDQPYCGYQFAVVKTTLPREFIFDLVGPGIESMNHPAAAAVILDTIARWLYQESLNR